MFRRMAIIGQNIKRLREAAGISQAALARSAGVSQPTITDLENGKQLTTKKLASIAKALRCKVSDLDPDYTDGGTGHIVTIPVRGIVAAGLWFEYDDLAQIDAEPVAAVVTKYRSLEQFAFKVSGPSVDRLRIFDGDYVICVPYWEARREVTEGDIVVVERRDGHKIERTCKEVEITPGGYNLWPRSTDSRFQAPIFVPASRSADGVEIEIIGLVISSVIPR